MGKPGWYDSSGLRLRPDLPIYILEALANPARLTAWRVDFTRYQNITLAIRLVRTDLQTLLKADDFVEDRLQSGNDRSQDTV